MRSILIALPLYVNRSHAEIRDYLKRLRFFLGAKSISDTDRLFECCIAPPDLLAKVPDDLRAELSDPPNILHCQS